LSPRADGRGGSRGARCRRFAVGPPGVVERTEPVAPSDFERWCEIARRPRLALLLDLDGTLVPFAPTAEEAVLDGEAVSLLDALHEVGIQVVIVTGRNQPLVDTMRPLARHAWWFAEHGAWRSDGGAWTGPPQADELDDLDELARTVGALDVAGARLERKTLSLCVHWREVAADEKEAAITAIELACDEWLEERPDYERIAGVECLEVRLRSAHKGAAVTWVRERLPGAPMIAIGDDVTDEDMFAALGEDDLAVAVLNDRRRRSRARVWLSGPPSVRGFLRWLVDVRGSQAMIPPPLDAVPSPRTARPRSRLVVVSNRTPAPPSASRERNVGGLVSALEPALQAHEGLWLGWSGQEVDGPAALTLDDDEPERARFDLPPVWRKRFYTGFCNRSLWPLLHGFPGRVRYADDEWHAYVEVNEIYARFAAELAEDDGTIWIHDYHLFLAAGALRRRGHVGPIGLFLHVPFPPIDVFETLPWHDEVLSAMRDFDLIGLHTQQWADNLRAALAVQDARDRSIVRRVPDIAVLPIGIDVANFTPTGAPLDREVAGLDASLGERRLVLGVDRLDYAKGIPERLVAFERLLERYPAWRGKVSFIQISVPSRADVPEYAELRHQVENLVGRINGRFGEAAWVPVRYLYRSYDHRVLAQLYRAADVALVTPLRDGLNLVAKEFVAAQDPAEPGVLVLSRFAGAAAELADAVLTNPYHADGLAADLDRALQMPLEERRRRHARMFEVISASSPQQWAAHFLERLVEARRSLA
jgi:trehalose 6-phosphate synthase